MFKKLLFLHSLFWICIPGVLAQGTGATISGTVKDQTEAVLPGVSITITHVDTGTTRALVSDDGGRYHAPNLALGNYELRAELAGFQSVVRTGIALTIGREAIVDFALKIGEVSETVTVSGEAPLVEVRQATLAELVGRDKIDTLPLNGRSFQQLAVLQPGAFVSTKARSDASRGKGMKINAAGTRHSSTQFLLDGMEISDARSTSPASMSGSLLGVESVREFKVLTNAYSAEYGHSAGAVVLISTRSGTNEFHGSVYEFHRNDNFDARNFFDRRKPEFKRNQYGFSLEGPIRKNKTFLLFNYEGLRERLGVTRIGRVPDAEARRGILPGAAPVTVAPEVKPYLDLMPLPNGRNFGNGVGEFIWSGSDPTEDDYYTLRMDHTFSESNSLFGRYTADEGSNISSRALPLFQTSDTSRSRNVVIEESSILTPTLLNQVRAGYNRVFRLSDTLYKVSIPPEVSYRRGERLGALAIQGTSGLEAAASDPQSDVINTFEGADNISYTRGNHDLKFGVQAKRYRFKRLAANRSHVTYDFASLLDFLTLRTISNLRAAPLDVTVDRYLNQSLFGFYVQDSWRARPTLNFNLGLRYEFVTVPHEVRDREGYILDPLRDPKFTTGAGLSIFRNPSLKNFGPRVGFAWDISGRERTAVRGGFGIFYDQLLSGAWGATIDKIPPFGGEIQLSGVPARPLFPKMPDSALVRDEQTPGRVAFHDYYAKTTYVMQYNLSVQHELSPDTVLTVAYAGSRGVHLQRKSTPNVRRFEIRDGAKFFPVGALRINPNFDSMEITTTDGNSVFNAAQVGLNRRFAGGFSFQGSYNFSRAIDDMSQISERAYVANLTRPQDAFDRTDNRGLADFDVRHSFVVNGIYDLPLGAGRKLASNVGGLAGKLLEGWQIAGIMTLAGGAPMSVELGFDRARSAERDGQRPLLLGTNNNPTHPGNPDRYFDVEAFGLPPAGFLGGPGRVGRNTMIGPGTATVDFSLLKNTSVGDRVKIQFRGEIFNVANRANFQVPGSDVTGAIRPLNSAGALLPQNASIIETSGTSRQIQLGLKIVF